MSQADPTRFEAEPPRRGWFGRNWLWFVPTLLGIPILLCGGCIGGSVLMLINAIKGSEVYKVALERVQQSPEVQAKLGQPIEDATVLPSGNINLDNDEGKAHLMFSVKGPSGTADVDLEAMIVGDQWHYEKYMVTCSDGSTIDLSDEPVVLEDDAPVFDPGVESPEPVTESEEEEESTGPPPLNIQINE
jgi:hypothetical protein